jgi:F-type H+-transporting ATPase subunit delta
MKTIRQLESEAKRLHRLCLVDGYLNEDRVRQVVGRVLESKRRGSVALLSHFRRLVKLDCARHTATVESAIPLAKDLQTKVSSDLERVYGPKLSISFACNPALVGGMRIKIGSDVYDNSVKARLAALARRFES